MQIKDRVVIFPDIHFPNHDEKAFKCALKIIKIVQPTGFVLIGDTIDGESVSHWQYKKKKRPPLEYQLPSIVEEVAAGNEGIDRIDEELDKVNCKKKIFTQGNHELWFDHFVEENPFLSSFGSRKVFKFDERGYQWFSYGKITKVFGSKLYVYHGGHYGGIAHTRTHALQMGCNIIYGHTHDCQKSTVQHIDGPHMAHSMGCLSDMKAAKYLKNRPVNWSHNVGIVDLLTNGNFNLVVLNIHDGVTTYNGKIVRA